MSTTTLRITGFLKIFGRNYGIEEPYWGPSICRESTVEIKEISAACETWKLTEMQYCSQEEKTPKGLLDMIKHFIRTLDRISVYLYVLKV